MKRILLAAAATVAFVSATAASAITFTYAQYGQTGTNGQSVSFVNNGGATPSGTISNNGAQTVKFKFYDDPSDNVTLPSHLTTEQDAQMIFTGTTSSGATFSGPGNLVATQTFETGSISFVAMGGVDAGKNLVTIDFTNLWLMGLLGANTASTITSTPYSTLNITSDFFNFSGTNSANFSLSMSAVIPSLSVGANGVLNNFSADSSGTFASDPAPVYVPEPGMLGLFGAGALGLGLARRRKK